mgnify:CR=1 FL=1|tara:strand:- start:1452 stop:1991 length:540 start_codon:yes stop_codon:yes gene_type:complete
MANIGVQTIEPWIYPGLEDINNNVNDTNYGLMDIYKQNTGENLKFQQAMTESTGYQDNYINTGQDNMDSLRKMMGMTNVTGGFSHIFGKTPPSSLMGTYMNQGFGPGDYADEVEPMEPDYEQDSMNRTLDSAGQSRGGFDWGGFSDSLMGLSQDMRSRVGNDDLPYLSGSKRNRGIYGY